MVVAVSGAGGGGGRRWQEVAASPNLPCDGPGWPCLGICRVHARAQDRLTVLAKIKTQRGDVHPSSTGVTLPCRLSVHRYVPLWPPTPGSSRQTGCFRSSFPIGSEDSPTSIGKEFSHRDVKKCNQSCPASSEQRLGESQGLLSPALYCSHQLNLVLCPAPQTGASLIPPW